MLIFVDGSLSGQKPLIRIQSHITNEVLIFIQICLDTVTYSNKAGNVRINVTLTCFRVTIFAVERQ